MLTITAITAIIRALPGHEDTMRDALAAVADRVQQHEPGTIGFHVSQDLQNPCVFTTYERFADQASMDLHNGSDASAGFFRIAKPILDGEVVLVTASELLAKR